MPPRPLPPARVGTDAVTGCHDQPLHDWSPCTGRLPSELGDHRLQVLRDDRCARLVDRGACDCAPSGA